MKDVYLAIRHLAIMLRGNLITRDQALLKTLKVVLKDENEKEYNPWVDAFQDEWIAILTARRKESNANVVIVNGIDTDDFV